MGIADNVPREPEVGDQGEPIWAKEYVAGAGYSLLYVVCLLCPVFNCQFGYSFKFLYIICNKMKIPSYTLCGYLKIIRPNWGSLFVQISTYITKILCIQFTKRYNIKRREESIKQFPVAIRVHTFFNSIL